MEIKGNVLKTVKTYAISWLIGIALIFGTIFMVGVIMFTLISFYDIYNIILWITIIILGMVALPMEIGYILTHRNKDYGDFI